MKYCHACGQEFQNSQDFCSRDGIPLLEEAPGPDETNLAGIQLGPLVLQRELSRSARGVLYRAHHTRLQQLVLARVYRPRTNLGRQVTEEMQREVTLASKMDHPNIIKVYEFDHTEDGFFYLAMEHLEMEPLDQVMRELGALELELALAITRQVLQALEYAHGQGIIHRNLTPASIMLAHNAKPDQFVKLTEFGLSKQSLGEPGIKTNRLVQHQLVGGTPWYLSPEALRGDKTDHRVDIYATGMLLYQMLTGVIPFQESVSGRLIERVLHEPAPTISRVRRGYPFPQTLSRVVSSAIAKRSDIRPQSASEFHRALEQSRPKALTAGRLTIWSGLTAILIGMLFGVTIVRDDLGQAVVLVERGPDTQPLMAVGLFQLALLQSDVTPEPQPAQPAPQLQGPPRRPARGSPVEVHCLETGKRRPAAEITRGMITVPAGLFYMGSDQLDAEGDERPARRVQVPLFMIDRYEVTRAAYRAFLADLDRSFPDHRYPSPIGWRGRTPPDGTDELPVSGVSWHDAYLCALWLGKTLPTEAEWEKAARGPAAARLWPWGDTFEPRRACFRANQGPHGPVPVRGTRRTGASQYNLLHMAGNVFEWMANRYHQNLPSHRVIRGGGFRSEPAQLRTSYREAHVATLGAPDIGFRCVYRPTRKKQ